MPPPELGAFSIPNPFAALGGLDDAAGAARAWIANRHNWVRVGWVLAGGVLFAVGLNHLIGSATGVSAGTVAGGVTRAAARVAR